MFNPHLYSHFPDSVLCPHTLCFPGKTQVCVCEIYIPMRFHLCKYDELTQFGEGIVNKKKAQTGSWLKQIMLSISF